MTLAARPTRPFNLTIARKIAEAEIVQAPWPHCVVSNIWPPPLYREMMVNRPKPEDMKPIKKDGRRRMTWIERHSKPAPEAPDYWTRFCRKFSIVLKLALEEKFKLHGRDTSMALIHDEPGYELASHSEAKSRLITALFYLPSSLRATHQGITMTLTGEDDRDLSYVPYAPNHAFIYPRTEKPFHAVGLMPIPRWTLAFDVFK